MKRIAIFAGIAAVVLALLAGCQQPGASTTYSNIIIDTYYPTGTGGNGYNFDVVTLFSAAGVVNAGNAWTSPTTGALLDINGNPAVDGQTGLGSNPNSGQQFFAYLDFKPPTPLPSGTVLYLRISGYSASASTTGADAPNPPQAYAVRVLTSALGTYTYFSPPAPTSDPYESGDTLTNKVPVNAPSVTVDDPQGLERYLGTAEVDWVKITLP